MSTQKWFDRIISILLERSTIKANQLIIHECIKGIFNNRLLEIDSNKEIKQEMAKFIEGIASGSKEKIWNVRCNQINKLEKYTENKKEIIRTKWENRKIRNQSKGELNKDKKTQKEKESEENLLQMARNNINRNNKKLMSRVIADRYIEILITKGEKVHTIWSSTYIFDLEFN
ncbi:hypothetical protein C1645_822756 [Glomus cerebriforme]|uniref:Uncharacterized protein n=1 Tax=Glomus cerebriforme TaxID=658196 RepID=A0A397T451_9GLOM|nr:hypothetical protein C1645_822756 [Glomus cerebriforme]